jgi:hypothetical protein
MPSKVYSAAVVGVKAFEVEIEVHALEPVRSINGRRGVVGRENTVNIQNFCIAERLLII